MRRRFPASTPLASARSRSAISSTRQRQACSKERSKPRSRSISISGTPTPLPRSSRPEPRSLLIAAVSGRQLAASARRAGLIPLVADFFADADTQELAHACCKLPGDIARDMTWRSLAPALHSLADAAPSPVLGLVYASGFEDRTELLTLIGKRWPLLGNDAATVARIKAPESFFAVLDRLGIKHPPTTIEPPPHAAGWLAKRIGGAGGSHIVAGRLNTRRRKGYLQTP